MPKGAEVTVIGIPKTKEKSDGPLFRPFIKIKPQDKVCIMLNCFMKSNLRVAGALNTTDQIPDVETNI